MSVNMNEFVLEDYLPGCDKNILDPCQKLLKEKGLKWCIEWSLNNEIGGGADTLKKRYTYMINCVTELYYSLKLMTRTKELDEEFKIIKKMVGMMIQLDDKCGIDEMLTSDLNEEDMSEILQKLDEDEAKFKRILKKIIESNNQSQQRYILDFVLSFGELIFAFNGYQPPSRNNPFDAYNDSIGVTDLYGELIDKIYEELYPEEEEIVNDVLNSLVESSSDEEENDGNERRSYEDVD